MIFLDKFICHIHNNTWYTIQSTRLIELVRYHSHCKIQKGIFDCVNCHAPFVPFGPNVLFNSFLWIIRRVLCWSRVRKPITLCTILFIIFTGLTSSYKKPSWIFLRTICIHLVLKTMEKTRALVKPFFSTIWNSSFNIPLSHSLSYAWEISRSPIAPTLQL